MYTTFSIMYITRQLLINRINKDTISNNRQQQQQQINKVYRTIITHYVQYCTVHNRILYGGVLQGAF